MKGPGYAPIYQPPGMQPGIDGSPVTSTTVRGGYGVTHGQGRSWVESRPEDEAAIRAARQEQEEAASQAAAARQLQSEELAQAEAAEAENARVAAEAAERARAEDAEEVDRRAAAFEEATTSASKARDFKDYWEEKSAPARFLAALIVGAGEAVNRGGGPSPARAIFDKYAERDRDMKLEKLRAAEDSAKMAGRELGDVRAAQHQRDTALRAAEIARNKATIDALDRIAKTGKGAQAMAAAKEAQDLAAKNRELYEAQRKEFAVRVTGERRDSYSPQTSTTTVEGKPGAAGLRDLTVFDEDGKPRVAKSSGFAEDLIERKASLDALRSLYAEARENAKSIGEKNRVFDASEREALVLRQKAISKGIVEQKVKLAGVENKADIEQSVERLVPGWIAGEAGAAASISQLEENDRRAYRTHLEGKSYAPQTDAPQDTRAKLSAADTGDDINLDDKPTPKKPAKPDAKALAAKILDRKKLRAKKDRTEDEEERLQFLEETLR